MYPWILYLLFPNHWKQSSLPDLILLRFYLSYVNFGIKVGYTTMFSNSGRFYTPSMISWEELQMCFKEKVL